MKRLIAKLPESIRSSASVVLFFLLYRYVVKSLSKLAELEPIQKFGRFLWPSPISDDRLWFNMLIGFILVAIIAGVVYDFSHKKKV